MAQHCAHCNRPTEPEWIAWSVIAQADICFRCYGKLPEAQTTARVPAYTPPPPWKPSPYVKFRGGVLDAWHKAVGDLPIFKLDAITHVGYCPRCVTGLVCIQFIGSEPDPPKVLIQSKRGVDTCSIGCAGIDIIRKLSEK